MLHLITEFCKTHGNDINLVFWTPLGILFFFILFPYWITTWGQKPR